ncbi:hypothetical protein KIPB_007558, partial [Kipferlia bialata]
WMDESMKRFDRLISRALNCSLQQTEYSINA